MKKILGKKILSVLLVTVLTLTFLGGCGSSDSEGSLSSTADNSSDDNVTIRLAVQKCIAIPYLADALGYFDEEFAEDNINVELVEFSLGPAIIEAVGSDEIDIGFLGDVPTFSGLVNGGDYKIIARWESDYNSFLIVRDDAGISSLSDLKGKKLAFAFGSTQTSLVYDYLGDAGLSDSDVELVNLSLADIVTSITNGEIDAAVVDQLRATQAVSNGGITKLLDGEGYKLFVSPVIATNSFTSAHPDLVSRVLKVLQKAAIYSEENNEEAIKIAAERIGVDESAIGPLMQECDLEYKLGDEEIAAIKENAKRSYELDVIKEDIDIEQYIDTTYLKEAGIQ
jgi:aliphatic sulfonates family ABC transporter substrate-binding protein